MNPFELMMSQSQPLGPKRRRADAPRQRGAWKADGLFNKVYELWTDKRNLQRHGGVLAGNHANMTEYVKAQAVLDPVPLVYLNFDVFRFVFFP